MTKGAGHKVEPACGKPQTKAPPADKSSKKEVKTSKPVKKGK
jgi:hypothetical protein